MTFPAPVPPRRYTNMSHKENRGGARPGAGQPPKTLSARQVAEWLKKAEERAVIENKAIPDILLDFIYDTSLGVKDRAACIKLWTDKTMASISEGGETDRNVPAIYLPQERPDPAKVVSIR